MIPETTTVLHVGQEVSGLEYLYRIAVSLVAFGGTALVVHWGLDAAEFVRSVVAAHGGGDVEQ